MLYRSQIDGRVLELTKLDGVYELTLVLTESQVQDLVNQKLPRIAIALVDPTFHRSK